MSGIAGLIHFIKPPPSIDAMIEAIKHRGVDGIKQFSNDKIKLANLKLNVTPESFFEKQPLTTNKFNTITADARIDNREEIIQQLNLKLNHSIFITDSEIILAAYEFWGEDCLYHLIGDFAFAIWDESKQQLFCGRDHSGVRPFYYTYQEGEYFAFASEIKGLLALDFVSNEINNDKIAIYLGWFSDNRAYQSDTFYKNIVSLKPANSLKVRENKIDTRFCWNFRLERFNHLKTEEDFINEFRKHFFEAVKCRIRTDYGIASQLSGGLDSSSISAVASILSDKRIITLHYDLKDESCDEKKYLNEILIKYNFNHYWITPTISLNESAKQIANIFDRPEHFTLPFSVHQAYQDATINCRVLLDGHEGDTVVGYGNEYISELLDNRDVEKLKVVLKQYVENLEIPNHLDEKWNKLSLNEKYLYAIYQIVENRILMMIKQGNSKLALKFLLFSNKNLDVNALKITSSILNKAVKSFSKNIFRSKKKQVQPEKILIDFEELNHNQKKHFSRIYSGGVIEATEESNHIAAHQQAEYAHPLLDKRLIELCLAIPARMKFGNGMRRFVFREAMKDILPDEIRLRTSKADFSQYLKKISQIIETDDLDINVYIDRKKLDYQIKQNKSNSSSNDSYKPILRAFYLNKWLK